MFTVRMLSHLSLPVVALLGALSVQGATPPALSNPNVTPEAAEGVAYHGALDGGATVSAAGNAAYSIPIPTTGRATCCRAAMRLTP